MYSIQVFLNVIMKAIVLDRRTGSIRIWKQAGKPGQSPQQLKSWQCSGSTTEDDPLQEKMASGEDGAERKFWWLMGKYPIVWRIVWWQPLWGCAGKITLSNYAGLKKVRQSQTWAVLKIATIWDWQTSKNEDLLKDIERFNSRLWFEFRVSQKKCNIAIFRLDLF